MRYLLLFICIAISIVDFVVYASKPKQTYLLTYGYKQDENYRYKKVTICNKENYLEQGLGDYIFMVISVHVKDTSQIGYFHLEYALDSTVSSTRYGKTVTHSKVELNNARLSRKYSLNGTVTAQEKSPIDKNTYVRYSDCSEFEQLFELPSDSIEIGYTWKTFKTENGKFINKNWNRKNKLAGIEEKNGHLCFRIDFKGDVRNYSISGDFQQVENGINSGSFWLDVKRHIIVAVEAQIQMNELSLNHPGGSGGIKPTKFIIMPSHSTEITLIE